MTSRPVPLRALATGRLGTLEPDGTVTTSWGWCLDWALLDDDGWRRAGELRRRTSTDEVGAVVTDLTSVASGTLVRRAHAARVGTVAGLVLTFENDSPAPVALAVRLAGVEPRRLQAVTGPGEALVLDRGVVRADRAAGAVLAARSGDPSLEGGDTLSATIVRSGGTGSGGAGPQPAAVRSRRGAEVTVVFPLAHRTGVRLVLAPDDPGRDPTVPSPDEVTAGWDRHLDPLAHVAVGAAEVDETWRRAAVALLGASPGDLEVDEVFAGAEALGALGAGDVAVEWLAAGWGPGLPRSTASSSVRSAVAATASVVAASGRGLEPVLGPTVQAAHRLRRAAALDGLADALADLAAAASAIDQPDVAADLAAFAVEATPPPSVDPAGALEALVELDGRWRREPGLDVAEAATAVAAVRSLLVADVGDRLDLAPGYPAAWLGHAVEVHRLPSRQGGVSFGIRWHGARPALLWQVDDLRPGTRLGCPSLDPGWTATTATGETLLATPTLNPDNP